MHNVGSCMHGPVDETAHVHSDRNPKTKLSSEFDDDSSNTSKLNERIHCCHRHCLHTQLWDGGWRRLHPVMSRNGRQRYSSCPAISQYQQLQWNVTAYRTCVFTYNCSQTGQQGCGLTVCITLNLLNIMAYAL